MCDPVTLTVAATAVAAGGQLYSGMAQRAQGRYESRVAQQNAGIERRAAADAMERGEVEQMRHFRRVAQAAGEQRARQAASGVDVNFGSAADLLSDVRMIGYEDSATIAENTVREARGYEVNAANYVMQGRAARSRGNAAMVGSSINAFSTILGGAKQISGMRGATATAGI